MRARSIGDIVAMIAVLAGIMMLTRPSGPGPGIIDAIAATFQHAANAAIGGQVSPETEAQAQQRLAMTRFFNATDAERQALIGAPGATVNASPGTGVLPGGGGRAAGGDIPFGPGLPG